MSAQNRCNVLRGPLMVGGGFEVLVQFEWDSKGGGGKRRYPYFRVPRGIKTLCSEPFLAWSHPLGMAHCAELILAIRRSPSALWLALA